MFSLGFVILLVGIGAIIALLFVLTKFFSSIKNKEDKWIHYASVIASGASVFLIFVVGSFIVNAVFSWIIGVDPLGEEAPLKNRYSLFCLYSDAGYPTGDIADGQKTVVVEGVEKLYMEDNTIYGWREYYKEPGGWTREEFLLDMSTGKYEKKTIEKIWKVMPVKDFYDERIKQVLIPMEWVSIVIGAIIAFFVGRVLIRLIRRSNNITSDDFSDNV